MSSSKILVIGSSNTDMVVQSPHLPVPGETVLGGAFIMNPGGKGANQAVAAARLGGKVVFLAKLGQDVFGDEALKGFEAEGIDTAMIVRDPEAPSGVALIMVDDKGENCISVALGANAAMTPADLGAVKQEMSTFDYLLIQLEIPIEVVAAAVEMAASANTKVVLNPAPAQPLSDEILQDVHIITPNQTEAELLTGVKVEDLASAREAASILRQKGIEIAIITMGARGAYVFSADHDELIASPNVKAVDTTAAGDTFNGALVVGLAEGMALTAAINFANRAAAISVTRLGAQASCPSRSELS